MIEAQEAPAALAAEEAEAVVDQILDSPDIEALAVEAGWKPADQWKGDGHMPASQYLKHQVAKAREKSDELRSLNKRMDKLTQTSARMMERQLQEQREELEGRFADAVAANKPAEARRINSEIAKLEAVDAEEDPGTEFKERHASWFGKDEDATALAIGICEREAQKGASYEDQLSKAEAAVKKAFPTLFGDGAALRKPAPVVGSPQSRAAPIRAREKTADTLPPEAKKALAGFLSKIQDPAKHKAFTERYVSEYNKDNG